MNALYKDFVKKGVQLYGLQLEIGVSLLFCRRLFGSILFKNFETKRNLLSSYLTIFFSFIKLVICFFISFFLIY